MSKKIYNWFIVVSCLMAAIMLTGCGGGSKEINLDDYLVIEVSGYDTLGQASWSLDEEKLEEDYGEKVTYTKDFQKEVDDVSDYDRAELLVNGIKMSNPDAVIDALPIIASFAGCDVSNVMEEVNYIKFYADKAEIRKTIDEFYDYTPIKMMTLFITGYFDKDTRLSNGEEITFIWNLEDADTEMLKDYFNYTVKFSDVDYTVSGLEEARMYTDDDLFGMLDIEFKGTSPNIIVSTSSVNYPDDSELKNHLRFEIVDDNGKNSHYKKGDIFTVECEVNRDSDDFMIDPAATLMKDYVIDDVPAYMSEASEFTDEILETLLPIATERLEEKLEYIINNNISISVYDYNGKNNNTVLSGVTEPKIAKIYLGSSNGTFNHYNKLHFAYMLDIAVGDKEGLSNAIPYDNVYVDLYAENVIVNADGTVDTLPKNSIEYYNLRFYQDFDEFFNKEIKNSEYDTIEVYSAD